MDRTSVGFYCFGTLSELAGITQILGKPQIIQVYAQSAENSRGKDIVPESSDTIWQIAFSAGMQHILTPRNLQLYPTN